MGALRPHQAGAPFMRSEQASSSVATASAKNRWPKHRGVMQSMTSAPSNIFAGASRSTHRCATPYRISPLFIPTRNSELQTGIFVVPARLRLLDQHNQAAKPASPQHMRAGSCPNRKKRKKRWNTNSSRTLPAVRRPRKAAVSEEALQSNVTAAAPPLPWTNLTGPRRGASELPALVVRQPADRL